MNLKKVIILLGIIIVVVLTDMRINCSVFWTEQISNIPIPMYIDGTFEETREYKCVYAGVSNFIKHQ